MKKKTEISHYPLKIAHEIKSNILFMNEIESNLSKESADLDQYDDLFKKDWFIPVAAFNISL